MAKNKLTKEQMSKGGKNSKRPPSIIAQLTKRLQDNPSDLEEIVTALIEDAKTGSHSDKELLIKYLDGKPVDKIEMTGADGGPLETVKLDPKKYVKARKDMLKEDDV